MQLEQTLRTLTALPAVSGHEAQAAEAVAELFRPYCDTVEVDKNGNMLGFRSCGRKNAKTVLLDAHLDQIGFLVTEVLDGGFVRFAPVGGVDPRMLLGGEVTLLADEPLYGVVSCMPPHLLKAGEQDKAVPVSEMAIDTGLLDAKSRIRVGTPIVFGQTPISLAGDQLCSKCLDDRAGIASILLTMKQLKKGKKLRCNIAVLISAQEEVTGLGAQTGAFAVQPEYAIAVDVTHGKTPDGPSDGVFDLGSGAAIGTVTSGNRLLPHLRHVNLLPVGDLGCPIESRHIRIRRQSSSGINRLCHPRAVLEPVYARRCDSTVNINVHLRFGRGLR